jgi:hypothetical protein
MSALSFRGAAELGEAVIYFLNEILYARRSCLI